MNGISGLRQRTTAPASKTTNTDCSSHPTTPAVNPFVHNIDMSVYDKIKVYILTVILLPLRLVAVFACLLIAYLLACIGTIGLSQEDLIHKPMTGWRRELRTVICWWMCKMFFNMGFYRVTIKGIRATEREAPILALAPHSSFSDAFPVVLLTAPSLVVKQEVQEVPFFAKLINYTQPVYVWREDPDSRQNTIKEIKRRTTSPDGWQQILIFPEGTCSNRKGLITFKPGAFYPGVPVQPVCIRYPNRLDTLSWTWQGPGALELLWLTMTQFYTYCELEFLPVYVPTEEEKCNPKLFASNVRDVMAKALQVPIIDYSYEDCRLMSKAKKLGLPPSIGLIEVQNVREEFGLDARVLETDFLEKFAKFADASSGLATAKQFARYLRLPVEHPKAMEIFEIYDSDRSGMISFKKYVRGRCTLSGSVKNSTRTNVSWDVVKQRLKLSPQDLETIDSFVTNLKSDANENDVLDHLYAAVPEWSWIVSDLCNSRLP
ncbi:lysophosphatidylcholine acyltransferase-like isoform X1 [Daphnia pulicaria]|uniref:lysophosphatidylcholine acyltransferase-like isoform X1 n=1 Tax=Daphnia pulicaria TaxID=35523 RepID=UPI001EEB69B2|nr:lysophosphatidylcholine acyltransferase-like isoform X1 [Daphnia pulicaria]XP_046639663.1 lysophosphatidylcholine acyltransferase-like isoform X1 [Daphnia pulicaria]